MTWTILGLGLINGEELLKCRWEDVVLDGLSLLAAVMKMQEIFAGGA